MRWLLSCLALSGFTTTVAADEVVYDNGAGGAAAITSGLESDVGGPWRVAEDVQLSTTTHVVRTSWVGIYGGLGPTDTDDFTINIHADDSGLPGDVLSSFGVGNVVNRSRTGFNVSGLDVFEYSANIDYVFLSDVRYFVSIVNNTANNDWGWGAIVGDRPDLSFQSFTSGETWNNNSSSVLDFRLHAVPEPSSIMMLSVICLWCVCRLHRVRGTQVQRAPVLAA